MTKREDLNLIGPAVDRRRILKCMAWAGTGVVWAVSGGVPRSLGLIGEASVLDNVMIGGTIGLVLGFYLLYIQYFKPR